MGRAALTAWNPKKVEVFKAQFYAFLNYVRIVSKERGEIILGEILSRFNRIEMVGPPPRYRASFTLRGLDQLNLSVSSAPA